MKNYFYNVMTGLLENQNTIMLSCKFNVDFESEFIVWMLNQNLLNISGVYILIGFM